jgi:hypothetical protein
VGASHPGLVREALLLQDQRTIRLSQHGYSMLNPWFVLTFKAMQIGFEAQNVIVLRSIRLSAGGARGQNEARLMVSEKIAASVEAQATAVSGLIKGRNDTVVASRVLRGLRKRVRSNKRRLSLCPGGDRQSHLRTSIQGTDAKLTN